MRSGRSKTLWLLASLGAAFALLAWSAERAPQVAPASAPAAAVSANPGRGFFGRLPLQAVTGIDSVSRAGGGTTCATYTWGGAMHPTVTVSPCAPPTRRVRLRRLP